jgi:hypothetical protein
VRGRHEIVFEVGDAGDGRVVRAERSSFFGPAAP